MKRFIIPLLIIGSMATTAVKAQGYVHAHINIPFPPVPRFFPPAPPVAIYPQDCPQPQPYVDGYAPEQVIVTERGPGYGWRGYDRGYREHYHENRFREYPYGGRGYYHEGRGRYEDRGHGRDRRRW